MNRSSPKEINYIQGLKNKFLNDYNGYLKQNQPVESSLQVSLRSGPSLPLKVKNVGYNLEESVYHRTDRYELLAGPRPTAVFRRGQPFSIYLYLNQNIKYELYRITFILSYGPNPSFSENTKVKITASETSSPIQDNDQWRCWVDEYRGSLVKLKVQSPVNCQVGLWNYEVEITQTGSKGMSLYDAPDNVFYILFNPWCKDDEVYLTTEEERNAYVLSDHDHLFKGTEQMPTSMSWIYGQFDYVILPALMLLLENAELPHSQRGSAILISRALSFVINYSPFDQSRWPKQVPLNGLLLGAWPADGKYPGGTPPMEWTGSSAIFQQYLESHGQPVNYGQCWVFAGCLATACRALGIPCRTITCFNAGHDSSNDCIIEYFLRNGQVDPTKTTDSTWNYHLWNEVWCTRPDLPPGYDGWQVIDGTPLEPDPLTGENRVGPVSVKAVREGEVDLKYDTLFVFNEVNADIFSYHEDPTAPSGFNFELNSNSIGNLIVTNSIKSGTTYTPDAVMENITNMYKYNEGGAREREVFYKVIAGIPKAQALYDKYVNSQYRSTTSKDVVFTIKEIASVTLGEGFNVSISLQNTYPSRRTVEMFISIHTVLQTGQPVWRVKDEQETVMLGPNETKNVIISVLPEDYKTKLVNLSSIKVGITCKVQETLQIFSRQNVFDITYPTLSIEIPASVRNQDLFEALFSFMNPYDEELTNCSLVVEGSGVLVPNTLPIRRYKFPISNIPPRSVMTEKIMLRASRPGTSVVIGNFSSDQLTLIKGSAYLRVF